MSLRYTHYTRISDGKIVLNFAGESEAEEHIFEKEDDAVEALAIAILKSEVEQILNSSSCNWPEEDGRPDFDYDVFLKNVLKRIEEKLDY